MKDSRLFALYKFFNHPVIVVIRLVVFAAFLILFFARYDGFLSYNKLLSLYFAFLANEVFVYYGLNRSHPAKTVTDANEAKDALQFKAKTKFISAKSAYEVISHFANTYAAKNLTASIAPNFSLFKSSLSKDELLVKAGEVVKLCNGNYISLFDLFLAYVLLTEHESKILQNSEIKEHELIMFYKYLRKRFVTDEALKSFEFTGNGAFDFFVFGWNREIQQYSWNLTENVIKDQSQLTIDVRKNEYEQFLTALGKSTSANVILKGDSGTGKTHLLKYFALQSHLGSVPENLKKRVVFEVFVDRLLSGVDTQGKLDERLNLLFEDLAHSGNAIIFIQNIENIFGGGGFGFDSSGALFEYLKNNRVQVVGTTTASGYAEYFENKQSIAPLFEVISIPPLAVEQTKEVLFEESWKRVSGIKVDLPGLLSIANYADEYYPTRALPGAAIDLLEEVVSSGKTQGKKLVGKNDIEELVQKKTHIALLDPTGDEKEKLLHLEDKIHERLINQEEAVKAIAEAMRRVRSGFSKQNRPIAAMLFLGPTGVGKTEAAKALAQIYFGDENAMIRFDMSELQTENSLERILGEPKGAFHQENALTDLIMERPFSLVLLDEFEKANPAILNVFLQVFEDGRLTSNKGEVVSFKNSIIIATSNAGSEFVRENINNNLKNSLTEYLLRNQLFRPELLNRFDELIVFKPLSQEHVLKVSELLLKNALSSLEDKQIYISFDNTVVEKIARESYDQQFGARNMRRYIEKKVEAFISKSILEDKVRKGDKKILSVDGGGGFVLN